MPLLDVIGSILHPSESKPNNAPGYSPRENISGKLQKGKLSKSDIGIPTNFKHVTHVGFSAVVGLDENSEMKKLLNLASVQEEKLESKEMARKLFDIIEKEEGMEAVQKMTRRMTSAERPTVRTRLRSLSSSSIMPSKRQNVPMESYSTKISASLQDGSPYNNFPFWSKVAPPLSDPRTFSHYPSIPTPPPVPPYLGELVQTISPANNSPVHRLSKGVPPCSQFGKKSKRVPPPFKPSSIKTTSDLIRHSILTSVNTTVPDNKLCADVHSSTQITKGSFPPCFPPSVPGIESSVKFEDVPSSLPPFSKCSYSETISPPLSSKPLQSKTLIQGTVPPAPPLPFKKSNSCTSEHPFNNSESQVGCQVNDAGLCSDIKELAASSEVVKQQNEPTLFLDQIRQGVQLKSVSQMVKLESAENCNFVSVLRDVIQKRHKAIHSSDEEDNLEEEEWED